MSFAQFNLNPNILKALEALKYTTPTPVQTATIPEILKGKDIIATAQTGSGKTAAFVLPILHLLTLPEAKSSIKPRVLILTPTRELAMQITKATDQYGKGLRLNVVSLLGGMPYYPQIKSLTRPVDIIVATPGRLLDHMAQRLDLSKIEILVLDEADRMLDMGFIDDVKKIAAATPSKRQTLLFSATTDDKVGKIIKNLLTDPVNIDLSSKTISPAHIKQTLYMADSTQHKARLFQHYLANETIYKAIIFSATKINTDRLAKQLEQQGYAVSALHGGLKQNVRNRTIDQFHRKGQLLVATDVAARGIDVAGITHVINYDVPKFCEDYVHRIGRTGRAGKSGIAISFGLPTDDRNIVRIERYIGHRFERATIEGMEPSKQFHSEAASPKKRSGAGAKRSGGSSTNAGYARARTTGAPRAAGGRDGNYRASSSPSRARSSDSRRDAGTHEAASRPTDSRRNPDSRDEGYRAGGNSSRGRSTDSRRDAGAREWAPRATETRREPGNQASPRAAYAKRAPTGSGQRETGNYNGNRRASSGASANRGESAAREWTPRATDARRPASSREGFAKTGQGQGRARTSVSASAPRRDSGNRGRGGAVPAAANPRNRLSLPKKRSKENRGEVVV